MHVLEVDASGPAGSGFGSAGSGQRLDPVQPREAAAGRRDRALAEVDDPAERLERPDELEQERDEEHELADRQLARDHVAPAEEEHGRDPERRQEEESGEEVRLDRRRTHRLVADRLRAAEEARPHVVLAAERLHHLDPDDRLVRRLGEVALPRLDEPRDREQPVREDERQDRDRRHRQRGVERQPRIDDREHDRRADDHHRALHALDDAPADEVADGVDVVRRARDHLAGRVPVEERARVGEVGVVEHPAQARLDRDPDPRGREAAREVDDEAQRGEQEDRAEVGQQPLVVRADDRLVDDALDQDRDRDRERGEREREREAERDQAALLPPEREKPAQGRPEGEIGRVDVLHRQRTDGSSRVHADIRQMSPRLDTTSE